MIPVADKSESESALLRLIWVLRNGKGFGLYFACCNALAYRRELVEKVKAEYAQPILEFDLTGHDGEAYIDHRLLTWAEDKTPGAPVFCYGLETLLPTRDEDRQFRTLQEINWRRNVYSQLNRNLVIWLPEYALNLLARTASDFYDWHTAVFEFPVPDSEKPHLIGQSLLGFMEGETHAANRMTLDEKKRWLSVLNGLLDETPKDTVEYARLLNDLGRLNISLGEYQESLTYFNESLDIHRKLLNYEGIGTALNNISQVYLDQGYLDKAQISLEDALNISDKFKPESYMAILNNISMIYADQGKHDKALEHMKNILIIARDIGFRFAEGVTLNNIAQIYLKQGDYNNALTFLENALKIRREVGDRRGEGTTLNNISLVFDAIGENKKALDYIDLALIIGFEIGDRAGLCTSLFNKGEIYNAMGNQAEAEQAWLESYHIAKEIGHAEGLKALEKLAKDLGKEGLSYWESQS